MAELVQMKHGHLAVLLPARLFNASCSASATHCANIFCRHLFTYFERKTFCGKCGDAYCSNCATRSLPLLETTRLPFDFPPRSIPIAFYYMDPSSPRRVATICDDCYSQIHGHRFQTKTRSEPSLDVEEPAQIHVYQHADPTEVATQSTPTSGLDAYPLKENSAVCKRKGLGLWNPVIIPETPWKDLPLGPNRLRPYQAEILRMEAEEEAERGGHVVKIGEFQYRTPAAPRAGSTTSAEYRWAWYKPLSDPGF
ncbi:hypothetical protein B0H11DRAFT_2237403 [Mycena galericulata]|nr:hypothetical protein B0H11DRAFT_2237403 [Mycena galericulata]